jgi:hypothetical protein
VALFTGSILASGYTCKHRSWRSVTTADFLANTWMQNIQNTNRQPRPSAPPNKIWSKACRRELLVINTVELPIPLAEYEVNEEVLGEACGKLRLTVLLVHEFFLVVRHIYLIQLRTINY